VTKPDHPAAAAPCEERILVATVNYRTAELARRCLASLAGERAGLPGLEAVVVDNDSGDGSVEALRAAIEAEGWDQWVRVVASDRNGGFAFGNNLAVEPSLHPSLHPSPSAGPAPGRPVDHYLLLNPDCEVSPGAIATLVEFLRTHPRAGVVGPATEVGRGNLRGTAFRFPGVLSAFDEGLHFGPVSRLLGRWIVSPPPRPDAHLCDWVSGGCMLVRREVFEEVGPMDESYFLYFEEVDFTLAAHRGGWECWYVPEARILHDAGASTGATGEGELAQRMPRYWFESRRRYWLKNRSRPAKLAADLAWASGSALWNLRRLITGEPAQEPPGFWWDFVRFNLLGIHSVGR
jgi:N-acetylglucosaminyl-diphospho-decaprenol L-rhamnosyltransferase